MERYYLRTHQGLFLALFKLLDVLLFVGAGVTSHRLLFDSWPQAMEVALLVIATLLFHIGAGGVDLYKPWRGMKLRYELWLVVMLSAVGCASVAVIGYVLETNPSLVWAAAWAGASVVLLSLLRVSLRPALRMVRRRGFNLRRIAFVGVCDHTVSFFEDLNQHPEFGYQVMGYFDDRQTPRLASDIGLEHLGCVADLEAVCQARDIDQVWLDYPLNATDRVLAVTKSLAEWPITIRHLMQINSISPLCGSVTGILGTPVLDLDLTATDGFLASSLKTVSDRTIACLVLISTLPLTLIIAAAIKLTSPGPVIYRQKRVTWRNTDFEMLKFRSMPMDAEAQSGPTWSQPDEPRATKVGAFLRRTSLDELPQFWNVVRGDMSIVGPRPERPEFVEQFRKDIPNYMKKHRVKAGITGWAQVHGLRGATDLNERINYDLYYIKNSSFLLDMKIMALTAVKGFTNRNAY